MHPKDRLDIASKQLDRVLSFFARIEAKASFIFAVDSALLALVALNVQRGDLSNWYIVVPASLSLLLIVISLYFVYRCSFPNLSGGSNSLIYFHEIAKRREVEYVDEMTQATEDVLTRDIAAQTWRNSEILKAKYKAIKVAFILTALALVPWFVFLTVAAIAHPQLPAIK